MLSSQTDAPLPGNAQPPVAGEASEGEDKPTEPETLSETEDFPVWLHSGG